MEIGGENYTLYFSDQDVAGIEQQYKPIAVMFHPVNFGFDMARIFLQRGLKKETPDGTYEYAFTQDAEGAGKALQVVKLYTGRYSGPVEGVRHLYELVSKALVISGWYKDLVADPPKANEKRGDPSKNCQRPTKRPTRKSLTDFAASLRKSLRV